MNAKASFSRIIIFAVFIVFLGAFCVLSISGTSGVASGGALPQKTMTEVAESGLSDVTHVTISSKEELDLFSDYVNSGNTTENITFLLEADIDYNDIATANAWCEDIEAKYVWTPAGTEQYPFAGIFSGNGHTIGGLYVNGMGSAGFFGTINGAYIEGLNISDSCFISAGSMAGTIAGKATNSTVSDCSTNQRFKEDKTYNSNQVSFWDFYSYQWYSYNSASVKAVSKAGGLVGHAENTTVENSYSFAFVEGSDEVGGIVGELNGGSVINCYSKGKLTNTSSTQTGGITGKILNGASVEYGYYFDEIAEFAIGGDGLTSPVSDTETVSSFGLNGKLATPIEVESSVCGTIYAALNVWAAQNANRYWTNAVFPELTVEPYTALPAGGDTTSEVWNGTTAASFAGGAGTEADPYQIATAEQLKLMSDIICTPDKNYQNVVQVVNGYTVGAMRTAHYILTANILLNDETFEFISDTGLIEITDGTHTAYRGSGIPGAPGGDTYFDNTAATEGTYYEKSGSLWTESAAYSGTMNVWVPIGTVYNPFKGVFDGNGYTVSGMYIKGTGAIGLFGDISAASKDFITGIKNVTVSQSLVWSEDATVSGDYAAGIVSYASGYSRISNCKNGAIIIAKETAGGIAASMGNTFGVRNCVNEGVIIKNVSNINYFAGGIVGEIGSPYPIVDCVNTGDILSPYQNLGGILGASDGYSRGLLYHCYNSGNIRGESVLGGIIGYAKNNTFYKDNAKSVSISGCENYGEITGYNNLGGDNVGGIGGLCDVYTTISGCNNFGDVSSNAQNAGGILGQGAGGYVFLLSCNNYGDISANGKKSRCSKLYETCVAGHSTLIYASYDECNPFGMMAGKFGDVHLTKNTAQSASQSTIDSFDSLSELFAAFMGNFTIPTDGTEYTPTVSGDALNDYTAFYNKAKELYDGSLVPFAQNVSYDLAGSAVIGINHPYSMRFGADIGSKPVNLQTVIAKLFGFDIVANFTQYAQNLAGTYADYRTRISNPTAADQALENGCFYTANGSFVFPIAVKSEQSSTVLTYVILDTTGLVSVWVNDIIAALWTTNFNSLYYTSNKIYNELYCKNQLFIKEPEAYAGGIAGFTSYTGRLLTKGIMETFVACVNFGSVTSPVGNLGGITACAKYTNAYYETINFTFLSYCVNYGAVQGESYTAGIASKLENVVANGCINYGAISSAGICAGGICAYQNDTISTSIKASIYGCVNKGAVTAASQAGGITGAAYSYKIENSYNTGTVHSASNYSGGIIGYCNPVPAELYSCYYLAGCATDGLDTVQNAVGNITQGETTADLSTVKSFTEDGTLSVTIDNTDFTNLQSALRHYVKNHFITNASGFTDETIPGIRVLTARYNIKIAYIYNYGNDVDPRNAFDIYVEVGTNKVYVNYVDDTLFTPDLYPILPGEKIIWVKTMISQNYAKYVIDENFVVCSYADNFTDGNANWIVPIPGRYLYAQKQETGLCKPDTLYVYNETYDGSTHYIKVEAQEYDGYTASYQWRKYSPEYRTIINIQGATSSTYGVKNLVDSGEYYCQITLRNDETGRTVTRTSEKIVVTINKPAPSILTEPTAANAVYYSGMLLRNISLTGGTSNVSGRFDWKSPDTGVSVADNGSQFTVVFTPNDSWNYSTFEFQIPLTIEKATPKINTPPTTLAATYFEGITLEDIQLKSVYRAVIDTRIGTEVNGTFVWKTPETAVSVANDGASFQVRFVPTDSTNYNEVTTVAAVATIHISKALPTVTTAPTTNVLDYVYNMTLADFALSGGEGSVPGSFAWIEPNTKLHVEDSGNAYSVTFTPTDSVNYNTATCYVQISLNPGINSVISSGYDEEYDGASHGISVTPAAGTVSYSLDNIDWTLQNPVYKDVTAEPITVYFKVESPDFVTFNGQQTVEIRPKQISVSWGARTLTYNGTAQKPKAFAYTGISGETLTVNVTGEQTTPSTSAYTATASITDPNYTLTNTSTEFYIAKANYDMSGVTFENVTSVYDGAAHSLTLSGTLPTGHDGIQVTVSFDRSASATSVSEVAVTATFATTSENYNIPAPMTATITITKADYDMSGVTIENVTSVYDGAAHSLTVGGTLPIGLDGIQVTVSYEGSATAVSEGAVTVTATFATASGNYNIPAPMTATITITKADYDMGAVVWDYTNPFIADGTVKTVSLLHLPEGVTAQYTGNSAAAPNAYTASAVLSGNPNYNTPSVAALEWIINPSVITDAATDITVENDNGFDLRAQLVIEKRISASGDTSALLLENEIISGVYHARLLLNGVEQPAVGTYTIRIAVDTDAQTVKVLLYQDGAYSETTATVSNGIAVFVVEKLGEFALVGTETPASANLWWLWLLIALIAATFAGYVALYLLWKRNDFKPIAFLIPTFRQINKLFFQTKWNDIELKDAEIKANQSEISPKE